MGELYIKGMDELEVFCEEEKPEIGVLAIPKGTTDEVAKKLEALGIKGIWNFSHIEVTSAMPVETVHLSDSLMTLAYRISEEEEEE